MNDPIQQEIEAKGLNAPRVTPADIEAEIASEHFFTALDGYISWSPKEVFEAAYRVAEGSEQRLTFGDAIHFLKAGHRVARTGWNGKGMWLEQQVPDEHSKMTLPYLYLNYPADAINTPGARVPWLASQTDVLAEDWVVL